MKLPLRPFLVLLLIVLGFSIGMATLLNYFKFESTIRTLEGSRFGLVAEDIGNNIELSLGLGLSFGEIGTLQELIERHRSSDVLILSIEVLDNGGRVRYSTRPERAGQAAPAGWLAALRRPEWLRVEPDAFVAGRTMRNNFDVVIGGVAVRYDRGQTNAAVAEMGLRLIELGAAITAVLTLLGGATLSVLAKLTERAFVRAAAGFSGPGPAIQASALEAEVRAFREGVERAEHELGGAQALLQPQAAQDTA